MPELISPIRETLDAGPGGQDDFFHAPPGAAMATVSNTGLYNENLPVANMTVGEIRARFADRLDIDPNSTAEIDGRRVGDEVVVRSGQLLTFLRPGGEKGQ